MSTSTQKKSKVLPIESAAVPEKKSVVKILNFIEHTLVNPDVTVGNIMTQFDVKYHILNENKERFVEREISMNVGLCNIVKEIVANAIDNYRESLETSTKMTYMKITLDCSEAPEGTPEGEKLLFGRISVENDGRSIPIGKQRIPWTDPQTKEVKYYNEHPATICFGHMMAGTNYDNKELKKKNAGKNGMGAKATNVLSKLFVVDHADASAQKRLVITYKDNMSTVDHKEMDYSKKAYTKISFIPDYKRFDDYPGLDEDLIAVIERMCYDAAMVMNIPVYFTDKTKPDHVTRKIVLSTREQYINMFYPDANIQKYDTGNKEDLSVAYLVEKAVTDEELEGKLQFAISDMSHISFVNGMFTPKGGVHVSCWSKSIFQSIVKEYNKKSTSPIKLAGKHLNGFFALFVFCEVVDAKYDSQTKEILTNPPKIETVSPTNNQMKELFGWKSFEIIAEILSSMNMIRSDRPISSSKKISYGDKAQDANKAGKDKNCTLFIVEGDSAKTLPVGIMQFLEGGNDLHGVLSIKGKFMNVTNINDRKKIEENKEICMIKSIVNLMYNVDYSKEGAFDKVRYNNIAIFTDPDDDGFHIQALLLNFFIKSFKNILSQPDIFRIYVVSVPYARCWTSAASKKSHKMPSVVYYSLSQFQKHPEPYSESKMKQYKGLGSFGKEDFRAVAEEMKNLYFHPVSESDANALTITFDSKFSDERKNQMTNKMKGVEKTCAYESIDFLTEGTTTITEIMQTRKVIYDLTNLQRSIPTMDGLKKVQKQILNAVLKSAKFRSETPVKMTIASGIVLENGYEHGDAQLQKTMADMTHSFTGSNNIPLIIGSGQTGSRKQNGADAAKPRYVSIYVNPLTRFIYRSEDDDILSYVETEGNTYEPYFYLPVIPMVLVNGVKGVASGFSTDIPSYNPTDLVNWLKRRLLGLDNNEVLIPHWNGFEGKVSRRRIKNPDGTFGATVSATTEGVLKPHPSKKDTWEITEIPIKLSIDAAYNKLCCMAGYTKLPSKEKEKKKEKREDPTLRIGIKGTVNNYSTPDKPHFVFECKPDFTPDIETKGNMNWLRTTIPLTNMWILDTRGVPMKYESAEAIIEGFYQFRLPFYTKRREILLSTMERELKILTNRQKLLEKVIDKTIVIPSPNITKVLEEEGFDKIDDSFSYLKMDIFTLLKKDEVERLKSLILVKKQEFDDLAKANPSDLWLKDLDEFTVEYAKYYAKWSEYNTGSQKGKRSLTLKERKAAKSGKVVDTTPSSTKRMELNIIESDDE